MNQEQTFGACLRRLLDEKHLSASGLARQMGFRSRNSVFRILQDEVSFDKQSAFYRQMFALLPRLFDEEQWLRLQKALELSRLGAENYRCNQAMRKLILQGGQDEASEEVYLYGSLTGQVEAGATLRALLRECLQGQRAVITMTGCCAPGCFEALAEAVQGRDRACEVAVDHYLEASGTGLIEAIRAVLPLLYEPFYHLRMFQGTKASPVVRQLYAANRMMVDWTDTEGRRRYLLLFQTDDHAMDATRLPDPQAMEALVRGIHRHDGQMTMVNTFRCGQSELEDYLAFMEACFRQEEKREIYILKQDVPLCFIHPDVLVGPAVDGLREAGFSASETEMVTLVSRMYQTHLKRYQNIESKHKVTHAIFSVDAMRRFARTGRTTDHFFGMRALTPRERVVVLRDLREKTQTNPYFTIYFFKPGLSPIPQETGLYEGDGLLMTKPYTDYCLDGGHSETLLRQEELCARFKEYFLHDLMVDCVMSARQTLNVLDELILMAEAEEGEVRLP